MTLMTPSWCGSNESGVAERATDYVGSSYPIVLRYSTAPGL
jgi:hypothetical protein